MVVCLCVWVFALLSHNKKVTGSIPRLHNGPFSVEFSTLRPCLTNETWISVGPTWLNIKSYTFKIKVGGVANNSKVGGSKLALHIYVLFAEYECRSDDLCVSAPQGHWWESVTSSPSSWSRDEDWLNTAFGERPRWCPSASSSWLVSSGSSANTVFSKQNEKPEQRWIVLNINN